jgi:chorismate lyase/3-hydroxybenzoate synthase
MSTRTDKQVALEVQERAQLAPLEPAPPAWVARLAAASPDRWTHVTEQVDDGASLAADALEAAVAAAYRRLAARLAADARHPVRFWNFVPDIHADMGDGLDRYMVFNAGRFAAFREWFGPAATFDRPTFSRHVPTASAVGLAPSAAGGDPLVIHALATTTAGLPVENPRQVPAYSYSRRYGPLPPCFARATRIDEHHDSAPRLLVGGTASIVGEDSQHRDVRRQTLETFENLAHLVGRARAIAGANAHDGDAARDPLHAFTDLRVYIVRDTDADIVRELTAARFPGLDSVEYAKADLCRRELLVEIEGVAQL